MKWNLYYLIFFFCFSISGYSQEKPFSFNEKCTYIAHYGIINAGYGVIKVSKEDSRLKFTGIGKSNKFFDLFFLIRDKYISYVNQKNLSPILFNRDVYEDGYTLSQEYKFNTKDLSVRTKKGNVKLLNNTYDILSSMFYARTLPEKHLKSNSPFIINLFLDGENYPMKITYLGIETIKTKFGKIECMKFSPEVIPGRMFTEKDDLTIWLSNDKNRLLIKATIDILVGSVEVDIETTKNIKHPLSIID